MSDIYFITLEYYTQIRDSVATLAPAADMPLVQDSQAPDVRCENKVGFEGDCLESLVSDLVREAIAACHFGQRIPQEQLQQDMLLC